MALTENRRYTAVLGPIRKEYIDVTADTTNPDTSIVSLLPSDNIRYVSIKPVNYDLAAGAQDAASATISGKTVSVHDAVNTRRYEIEVTGF